MLWNHSTLTKLAAFVEQIQESIDNGSSVPESSEPMGQFAVVGIVMIGFLGYLFYEAFKKGE